MSDSDSSQTGGRSRGSSGNRPGSNAGARSRGSSASNESGYGATGSKSSRSGFGASSKQLDSRTDRGNQDDEGIGSSATRGPSSVGGQGEPESGSSSGNR